MNDSNQFLRLVIILFIIISTSWRILLLRDAGSSTTNR